MQILLELRDLYGNSDIRVIETDNLWYYDFAYRDRKILKLDITAVSTVKSSQILLFWNVDKNKTINWRVIIESEDLSSVCIETNQYIGR